jgi:hypothetical protein
METPLKLSKVQRENITWALKSPNQAFCAAADDPGWADLVGRGLAESRRSLLIAPSVYYRPTPGGRAALAHDLELLKGEPVP